MLVLSRSPGQSVIFGDYLVELVKFLPHVVSLRVIHNSGTSFYSLKCNGVIKLTHNMRIIVTRIQSTKVRLGFEAPENITILRSELA